MDSSGDIPSRWGTPSRRQVLGGGLAVATTLLSGCAKSGGTTPVIRFGHGPTAHAATAATAEGFFAKRGLTVTLTPIQSGPSAVAATVNGALDFTFGDFLGWAAALANGFTNASLIAPANGNGNMVILGRKGIDRPEDLIGRRLAVPVTPVFGLSVRLWLRKHGIDDSKVQVVIAGQGAEHALGRGDIDALLTYDPMAYRAQHLYGAKQIAGDPSLEVMPKGVARACYYANGDFLKQHPDTVEKVVAALHEGSRFFAAASPEKRAELVSPYIDLSVATMKKDMPGLIEHFSHPPVFLEGIDLKAAQEWVDIAAREKAIAKSVPIAPYAYQTASEAA